MEVPIAVVEALQGSPPGGHCQACEHDHEVPIPAEIIEALRHGRLVVFAGAGTSTETPLVYPYTFYDLIKVEADIPREREMSFPALMSAFCQRPNGRRELLKRIRNRFDYIESFPVLLQNATGFHTALSTIPHLDDIITTNWDDYFERFCGAYPVVTAEDYVFWDVPGRKVFKIHGSVNNYGSLVATEADYRRCFRQLNGGLVGATVKMVLGTKVVVYIGYSLRDHDFMRLYKAIIKPMKGLAPQSYVVTHSADSAERFRSLGLVPIVTDATHFIHLVKRKLVTEGYMLADNRFDAILDELGRLIAAHTELHECFSYKTNPELFYASCYQDGFIHALERMIARKKTGEHSCPSYVVGQVDTYQRLWNERHGEGRYGDVAYIDGYGMGLQYLLLSDEGRANVPRYFVFGWEPSLVTLDDYKQVCGRARELDPQKYEYAKRLTENSPDDIVLHHTPFLL